MIDLLEYGWSNANSEFPVGLVPARVTEMHRNLYKVVCSSGEVDAQLKGSFLHQANEQSDLPAVGDFVLVQLRDHSTAGIVQLLPRRSKFSRTDYSGKGVKHVKTILEQVIATNFDYVFILSSLNQDLNINRITRYLTLTRISGGTPVIVLTKADLSENWQQQLTLVKESAKDVTVVALSSETGFGMEQLQPYLQPGKTIVLLGMSGVGKSTLLNALAGAKHMSVKEIREDDARGRHTTTHRQLFKLPSGAMVIDTPGLREVGLWESEEGIHSGFADIEELMRQCHYSNCKHVSEPGCAVLSAITEGTLSQNRWKDYLTQTKEAAFVKRKKKPQNHKKRKTWR